MKTITGHDDNRLRHITTNSCAALLIGFATVIAGCSNDRQHSSLIEPTSVLEIDKTNLSQIVDSMRFIPLETSDVCLIGRIQKIKRRNDRFYIQADGRLMVFDGQGQFENIITEIGDGPDQVVSILDYDVSSDGDIAVSTSDKIVIYGLDGTLKKKIEHTYGYCSLRHTRDGWLAVTSDRLDNGNRMIAYDANWDTIHTMMPSPDFDRPNSNIDLIPLSDNVYFHQIGSGNEMFEYNYESGNSCHYHIIESPDMMSAQEYADYHGDIMESPKNIIRYITTNNDDILLES